MAGGLALAACTSDGDTSPVADPAEENPPVEDDSGAGEQPHEPEPEPDPPTDAEAVTAAYERFLQALTSAMEVGDPDHPELTERADGAGLVSSQAMVVSLTETDRIARGELVPSIESIEIDGDSAHLEDCYRVDLVEHHADTDEQVADRGGARFQASAQLERDGDDWIVTEFAEGDVCAPSDIAATVTDRYLAFWDATWDAADPPDPDHAGLADTAAGDHLDGLRAQLASLRDAGQVRRGRGVEHPVVAFVTAHDSQALIRDCVEEDPDTGIYDASTGDLVAGGTDPGQRTLLETQLELIDDAWRVVNVRVAEEDSRCEPGGS